MLYIGCTAKSGSHYTSEFLRRLGLEVRHEYPGRDGMITWYTHHVPYHFPPYSFDVENSICLHQTREPLQTISSLMLLDDTSWKYIQQALCLEVFQIPILTRCMMYYKRWHEELDDCTFTYPVEEITELLHILDLYGIKYQNVEYALKTGKEGATKERKPKLTWLDLMIENHILAQEIFELAKNYGYTYDKNMEQTNLLTEGFGWASSV